MTIRHLVGGVSALALAASALLGAGSAANATEGYFQTGYGTIQKAQSGAGVANPEDAMSLSVNPAGLVSVGDRFNAAFTVFSPQRDVTAAPSMTGILPAGRTTSESNFFLMPNMAYSRQIDAQSAWGVAIYGNGGMNTDWGAVANPACGFMPPVAGNAGNGLFCGGTSGVNLEQMFITAGYARRMGDFSVGVAPVVAIQKFRASGLSLFGDLMASSDPANFTNRGDDWAYGAGLRLGLQWNLQPGLRLGLTGQTPIWSTKFTKYAGLFADGGSFDIPGNVGVGLAWDAMPGLTLMADYRHIFYGSVPAIANSSLAMAPGAMNLGTSGGPGFGWRDVDVFAFAAAWKVTADATLRVGYSHNTNPVKSEDAFFNIFAPGIVTDHVSAGMSYQVSKNSGIDLAVAYVPRNRLDGFAMGGQPISLSMEQYEVSLGYSYKF
jgi:long-chain fatty acid transport protein